MIGDLALSHGVIPYQLPTQPGIPVDLRAQGIEEVKKKLNLCQRATAIHNVRGREPLQRFRAELRPTPHAAYALTWLRGPKCVASSSPRERIRVTLETTGALRFFEPRLFSASEVNRGKPAPDLFLRAAAQTGVHPADCIVVEDSPAGIIAATAAGMTAIGFVGGTHAVPELISMLMSAGACTIIADMRRLKATVAAICGW